MENYKVTKNDLKGELEGFPIEVVQRMVDCQVEQGNKADVKVFQEKNTNSYDGFSWQKTEDGFDFWDDVIYYRKFYVFFEKYPKEETSEIENAKQEIDTHVYYRGVAGRGKEIISELVKLGGINYYNISAESKNCCYAIDPKNKRINFLASDSLYSHILEECYTEKFLPEVKQEIIEIDGKKYNKQEVLDRINELKEVE